MQNKPHWMDLCQQASVEQDPEKLIELITEINHLLAEKEKRLRQANGKSEDTIKCGRLLLLHQGISGFS
jgi:hypothetical protein